MKEDWRGVFSVLVTPFDKDGNIIEKDLQRMIELLIEDGVHGLIVAGSTGEFYVMKDEERERVFEIAVETVRSLSPDLPLIANVTAMYTQDAVNLGKRAHTLGYDGIMVLPPYYATPSTQMIIDHYSMICHQVDLPIMLYNAPRWTGVNLNVHILEKLLNLENIYAIKDSSRNLEQLLECLRLFRDRIRIFVGLETFVVAAMALGAHGVVGMVVQAMGNRIVKMYELCIEGEWEKAREIQYDVSLIYQYSNIGTHYAALKELINQMGRPAGYPRRPLCELPDDQKLEISKLLRALNMLP